MRLKVSFWLHCVNARVLNLKYINCYKYIDYNADIIFLQECDKSFQEDLSLFMADYKFSFKYKSEHSKQGEAILIRSSRLK